MISDIFKLRQGGKFWGLELRTPIRTADSKRFHTQGPMGTGRARDTILSPVTPAESAANAERVAKMAGLDLGKVWAGDLITSKLDLIKNPKQLGDALSSLVTALADYGTKRGRVTGTELDETGTMTFQGDEKSDDPEPLGHAKRNPNDSATHVGDSMRKWRGQDRERIESVAKANVEYWAPTKPAA